MKKFACRDAGMNCDFQATGNTDEEIMEKCMEHGRTAHNMKLSPQDQQKMKRLIKNV
jgi:predicted small metal-binding protein